MTSPLLWVTVCKTKSLASEVAIVCIERRMDGASVRHTREHRMSRYKMRLKGLSRGLGPAASSTLKLFVNRHKNCKHPSLARLPRLVQRLRDHSLTLPVRCSVEHLVVMALRDTTASNPLRDYQQLFRLSKPSTPKLLASTLLRGVKGTSPQKWTRSTEAGHKHTQTFLPWEGGMLLGGGLQRDLPCVRYLANFIE
ncbi:hypothetical protein STEG23_033736 [Scotinomys teguina]